MYIHVHVFQLIVAFFMCVVEFGHWVCGESWLAVKDSLTHRPSSQGWAPRVLLPFCGVLSVLCSCVLFLCVSEVEVVIPFLYISLWLVCYTQ